MLLDMPPDQRCFLTVSYQSVNMAVPLNGLRVDRGMYLQFSLARNIRKKTKIWEYVETNRLVRKAGKTFTTWRPWLSIKLAQT